jgi:hypothetical protein
MTAPCRSCRIPASALTAQITSNRETKVTLKAFAKTLPPYYRYPFAVAMVPIFFMVTIPLILASVVLQLLPMAIGALVCEFSGHDTDWWLDRKLICEYWFDFLG